MEKKNYSSAVRNTIGAFEHEGFVMDEETIEELEAIDRGEISAEESIKKTVAEIKAKQGIK